MQATLKRPADIGVIHFLEQSHLADKAALDLGFEFLGAMQNFDGDPLAGLLVRGLVDGPKPADAETPTEAIGPDEFSGGSLGSRGLGVVRLSNHEESVKWCE